MYGTTELIDQLKDLLSVMRSMLEKYFSREEIASCDPTKGSNIYKLNALLNVLDETDDKEIIRKIAELCFNVYNHFARLLNMALPVSKSNPKKKLIERVYSIIKKDDDFYDHFLGCTK
jgi:hypothetical protein